MTWNQQLVKERKGFILTAEESIWNERGQLHVMVRTGHSPGERVSAERRLAGDNEAVQSRIE